MTDPDETVRRVLREMCDLQYSELEKIARGGGSEGDGEDLRSSGV